MSTSSSSGLSDTATLQDRVWLALRFGWTLAEVYGRLTENPLVDTPPSSTRLFISDLNHTPNEELWSATKRLIYLARQLFPPPKSSATNTPQFSRDTENQDKTDETDVDKQAGERRKSDPVEPPDSVDRLLDRTEQRILTGKGRLPRTQGLYDDLNQWSRQVWATLDAEDPTLAEAATLGARLADTFWQWRYPGHAQPASASKQTWQHLLSSQRMTATIRQVRVVEKHLPPHVGPMLRHSLWEWGIAEELVRSPSGELTIAYSWLYHLRSLGWARAWRSWLKARRAAPLQLSSEEERKLFSPVWKQLQNQVTTWEHLILNRPLARLLRPSDWRQVRWLTLILYIGATFVIVVAGGALFAGAFWLVSQLLGFLLPFLATPKDFKDQLTLATTIVVVLGFLVTQFRRSLDQLRYLYDSIYKGVMMRKLEQRSLRAWNGRTKPLPLIWLQRLLRAEDE